jgi:hypothetical protein
VSILGQQTVTVTMLRRSANNALIADLKDQSGDSIGEAKQKFTAGVLFGFKNGGKGSYTLTCGERTVNIDVGSTTTITGDGAVLGRIVPSDGAAQVEDSAGAVLARFRPFKGLKADDPWRHPIESPRGDVLGSMNLMRTHSPLLSDDDWAFIDSEVFGINRRPTTTLKMPALGTVLQLGSPVEPRLGDLLACATVDFSVLPRGYITT